MTESLKTLIIGGGSIGERHLRCFQQTGRTDVLLCEINDQLRQTLKDRYQLEHVFSDLSEAINQDPDLAVICTPAHLHIPIALQLSKQGIDLLIEKPVSTSLDGLTKLIDLVEQNSLMTGVAYVHRSNPVLECMRHAIRENQLGKPVQINCVSGQHFPYYRPAYRDIYYTQHSTGGGAVQDALTHLINLGEWFVGPVTSLVADAEHCVLAGVEVEDSVNVMARHGQVMASYTLNQHQAANETVVSVICENGIARFTGHEGQWSFMTEPETDWQFGQQITFERDTLFLNQAQAFLDCVQNRTSPLCTLEEGVHTLRVALAILDSVATREWKTIDA
jgi:predicted dehydrogenase